MEEMLQTRTDIAETDVAEKFKSWFIYGDDWHRERLIPALEILCEHCRKSPTTSCLCTYRRLFRFLNPETDLEKLEELNPKHLTCCKVRKAFGLSR